MTKKDYSRLAEAVAQAKQAILRLEPESSHSDMLDGVGYAIDYLCETLGRDNAGFNPDRFRAACS